MTAPASPSARVTAAQLDLLRTLTEAVGVSGDEGPVRQIVRGCVEACADDLRVDALGNLLVTRRGAGQQRVRVMVAAHMDEVGLMVTTADADGALRVETVGGLEPQHLLGKSVWVGRERLPGVIGASPPHLATGGSGHAPVRLEALRLDVGCDSREAALAKVTPGTWASFATRLVRLGRLVRAKALDDRLGVATLIELVCNPPQGIDLLAAFTTQEEIGHRGAQVAAFAFDPQAAVVLDCTPAHDQPTCDGSQNLAYNTRLGAGPALYVADRGTLSDPRLLRLFQEAAAAEGIPWQLRQPGGGSTDAAAIHVARAGVPSISVSVPARYLHTAASLASLADWRASVRLVYAALARLRPAALRAAPGRDWSASAS